MKSINLVLFSSKSFRLTFTVSTRSSISPLLALMVICLLLVTGTGCVQVMSVEGKIEPYEKSAFFEDGRTARPIQPGTVARGQHRENELLYTGTIDGELVDLFPFEITRGVMNRGQQRYDIFCSPCHSRIGDGQGMIVQRGFKPPPSFHIDRLREAPAGYYFDVITNGFGVMASYASRVPPEDRWAITAYIRALQLSQNSTIADLQPEEIQQLEGATQ